jgi:hypothetical protein
MLKTAWMLLGLASVFGAGIACFGLFSSAPIDRGAEPVLESCEGLEGQARTDCERGRGR